MKFLSCIVVIFYLVSFNFSNGQAPGSLDLSFGTQGKITHITGLEDLKVYQSAIKNTGSIVLTGQAKLAGGTNENIVVAVLKPDGTPDNSFNSTGYKTVDIQMTENAGKSLALQPDGKIVIVGWVHNGANFDICVLRLNSDGNFDTGFGSGGKIVINMGSTEFGMAVVLLPNGKILVTARKYNGFNSDIVLLRYLESGDLDTTFGVNGISTKDFTNANEIPYDCVVLSDGSILVVGDVDQAGFSVFFVAKYSKDGMPVSVFGNNGFASYQVGASNNGVSDAEIQSDGKIVIGGYAYEGSETTFALVRLNTDGTTDQTFGSSGSITTNIREGNEYINDILIQKDGKILACGASRGLVSNADFSIVRYLTDGNIDMTFGTNGIVNTDFGNTDVAVGLLSLSDDIFIAIGYSDNKKLALARYHNDLKSYTKEINNESKIFVYPNPAHTCVLIQLTDFVDGTVSVGLINSNGVLIKSIQVPDNVAKIIQMDFPENLPSGPYYIIVSQKTHHLIQKIIVL